jgi:hypothetical protein
MDHEAWEDKLLETFERREEEAAKAAGKVKKNQVMSKTDARTVIVGIRRTLLAFVTLLLLGASVLGFVAVASAHGYLAVLLFFVSILGLFASFTLLYAQGITNVASKESQGESK